MIELNCTKCNKQFKIEPYKIKEILNCIELNENQINKFDLLDILNVSIGKCNEEKIRHSLNFPQSFFEKLNITINENNKQEKSAEEKIKELNDITRRIDEFKKLLLIQEDKENQIKEEQIKINGKLNEINSKTIEETGLSIKFWAKDK